MTRADRIAAVEAELVTQRVMIAEAVAKLRGLEAELASLKAGIPVEGDLSSMLRTEAILNVLQTVSGTMSPSEILSRLHAAGRSDALRDVTATLNHLLIQDRVQKPYRGRYLAV